VGTGGRRCGVIIVERLWHIDMLVTQTGYELAGPALTRAWATKCQIRPGPPVPPLLPLALQSAWSTVVGCACGGPRRLVYAYSLFVECFAMNNAVSLWLAVSS
jgi:hypothetical protein